MARPHGRHTTRVVWGAATVALAAFLLFYRLGVAPLVVWDESRLANSALEMADAGLSLVTTYDGAPDHWNTKPPLLIWAMALVIDVAGASEWSVRLPAAASGLLVCLMVFWFCLRNLDSPACGGIAVLSLLASSVFCGWHGARSGNYDAPLALFTTGYLFAGYFALAGSRRHRVGWLVLCTLFVNLAFLTKSVQGLIFLPGLALFAAVRGHLGGLLRSPATYACVLATLVVCAGYYVAREALDPGYFSHALAYDLLGRYAQVIERHDGPWWFYVRQPLVALGLLAAGLMTWTGTGRQRELALFLLLVSVVYVAVISTAATKLWWYTIPLLPIGAVSIALAADRLLAPLAVSPRWARRVPAAVATGAVLAAGLVVARGVGEIRAVEQGLAASAGHQHIYLLRSAELRAADIRRFVVAHPGFGGELEPYYPGPVLFYARALRRDGYDVTVRLPRDAWRDRRRTLLLCGPQVDAATSRRLVRGAVLVHGPCGLFPRRR